MANPGKNTRSERNGPDLENFAMSRTPRDRIERSSMPADVDIPPFVGRIGGNGAAVISRCSSNEDILKNVPDAAPLMSLADLLSLKPFLTIALWKSALMEGVGTRMLYRT